MPILWNYHLVGGGNRLSECLSYAEGVDLISNMVKYSVGMPIDEVVQKPYVGYWSEIILHSDKKGIFKGLKLSNKIKKNIVDKNVWIENGTFVGSFESANQAIGTIILRFDDLLEMEDVLNNQDKYIKIQLDK